MTSFHTSDRHGYSVKFSPFLINQLAVATSQLYGLAGGGTLYILEHFEDEVTEICQFHWSDGLFDVVWSPTTDNIVATASGDGSLQVWNVEKPKEKPVLVLHEHKNEIYSLDWGEKWNFHHLLSASWDGTVRLWDVNRTSSLTTFTDTSPNSLIYCANFSPLIANLISTVSTDGNLNLWNSLDFSGTSKPLMTIAAHEDAEVLCCEWNKFDRNVLVTGGSDGLIRGWDLRNLRGHVFELSTDSERAVRRISFSPHSSAYLASANFDFTTK